MLSTGSSDLLLVQLRRNKKHNNNDNSNEKSSKNVRTGKWKKPLGTSCSTQIV